MLINLMKGNQNSDILKGQCDIETTQELVPF